jgi:hypothetical protein
MTQNDTVKYPRVEGYLRYDREGARARLHFATVKEDIPEIATRVEMIRGRVISLRNNFRKDARWALGWFNLVTLATVVLSLAAILIFVLAMRSFRAEGASVASVFVGVGFIATIIGAGSQAFGWHKRYGAMFSARWRMEALRTKIDQRVLEIALDNGKGPLIGANKLLLDRMTKELADDVDDALSAFGRQYGAAVEPVILSSFTHKEP